MFGNSLFLRLFHSFLVASTLLTSLACAKTASNTILVFARDTASAYSATSGLNGYGIPFQLVIVPQAGITLPSLNSTATTGNYGGFIILSEVVYSYSNGWYSAITTSQWQQLYDYQTSFGVRMVRLDVYPTADFGVTTAIAGSGCCDAGVDQLVSISNSTGFPTANIITGATMNTDGLWHYPAIITNSSMAWEVAQFAPAGDFQTTTTAAVINNISGRQQMVWFSSWATDWSPASNFLQHAYIHWLTRGLFVGRRRIYFNTQVDDVHLSTALYSPAGTSFRTRPSDLMAHASWMTSLNARLPAGSQYFMELAHNGNGDILSSVVADNSSICNPSSNIYYSSTDATTLEFQKPLGTGTNLWPTTPATYTWTLACAILDPLIAWLRVPANRDAFAHVSHTFTHESLNNATYSDVNKEITFNSAWMKQVGLTAGSKFSSKGLVPPAITGLHNGDAISAWMTNGITAVVGDNTRPVLMNTVNEHWPLISTVAANGYAGLTIMPRWATTIFYNCDLPDCTVSEWITTSAGSGDFSSLLDNARTTNTRHLLGLHHDGFMFHQANLRQADVAIQTIGTQTGQFSLLQSWVETVLQEMARLTTWPVISLKHDDAATQFTNRMALDQCNPNLAYTFSANGKTITAVTVTAGTTNKCSVQVPVTLPVAAKTIPSGATKEQVGTDPLTLWVKLSGSPVTITLATAISI